MILFPFPGLKKGGGRRGFKKKREHLIITNALYFLISNKNHIEKTMVMCTWFSTTSAENEQSST